MLIISKAILCETLNKNNKRNYVNVVKMFANYKCRPYKPKIAKFVDFQTQKTRIFKQFDFQGKKFDSC